MDDKRDERHSLHIAPPTPVSRHMSIASTTSSTLSSAPPTPHHPATSPIMPQHAHSPKPPQPHLRRTSSATSLPNQRTSTPKLVRKSSRQSLSGTAEDTEKRPTPKRSISNLIANLREAQGTMEPIAEPVQLTAAQIASEHFARELASHAEAGVEAETVVILHDACYGHRYSRPKTSKSALGMIVERPERIHASVLGASAAFVRMGGHYTGGRKAPGHESRAGAAGAPPFKIRRTQREVDVTSACVTNVHGTAWMAELQGLCSAASDRLAQGGKELSRSSSPSSTGQEKRQLHEGDLYLAPESLSAFQGALGGVADAVDAVFAPASATKRAFVAIRPPGHHCSADYPSGFCWLNNVHVGIEYAALTHGLTHAAILDFDLHHGDGSQAITWERNGRNNLRRQEAGAGGKKGVKQRMGPDIGYFSLHDINSYPCEMGDDEKVQAASLCIDNAHGQAVWNVHLQPWSSLAAFWDLYASKYSILLSKARAFLQQHTARLRAEGKHAKSVVFVSAGFDASEWEGAGMQRHSVNVPTEFYARFTRDCVMLAGDEGTAAGGRVVSVLEGGYSDRALCSGVMAHLAGLCGTSVEAAVKNEESNGQQRLDELMGGLRLNGHGASTTTDLHYDKAWWSEPNLAALELKVNPPPPHLPQGKRVRTGPQPTYATPTESFAYKVVNPTSFARSISGTMREIQLPARPPTPPLPEVDWVVATQELSKLVIPSDRQTRSCTAEELGGARTKKDRQSAMPVLTTAEDMGKGVGRQLRDRKGIRMPAAYSESAYSDEVESVRSVSRASDSGRRQTMHEFPPVPAEGAGRPEMFQRRASRRLSAGSAFGSLDGIVVDERAPPVPTLPAAALPTMQNGSMRPPPPPSVGSGIQMKKMRAPGKPRKVSPSSNTTTAPPPIQTSTNLAGPRAPFPATGAPPQGSNVGSPPASTNTNADVNKLAAGMKKISLKLGSREESERKAREREAAERRARALRGAETRRVNAAAKKAAGVSGRPGERAGVQAPVVESASVSVPGSTAREISDVAVGERPSSEMNGGLEGDTASTTLGAADEAAEPAPTLPPSQPMPRMQQENAATAQPSESTMDIEHPSAGAAPSAPLLQTEPSQDTPPQANGASSAPLTAERLSQQSSLVPDSAGRQLIHENNLANGMAPTQPPTSSSPPTSPLRSPTSKPKGRPLPTWSSTGPIPFATAPGTPTSKANRGSPRNPPSIKSPQRLGPNDISNARNVSLGNGVSRTMLGEAQDEEIVLGPTPVLEKTQQEAEADSIWDVPVTPQKTG